MSNHTEKPRWHALLYLPVAACVVLAALFLFGVLPPGQQDTDAAANSTPDASADAVADTPAPTLAATPPATTPGESTPAAGESTPLPGAATTGKPQGLRNTRYTIAAELFEVQDRFNVQMAVTYTNTTPDTLYELVFHLPANAFYRPSSSGAQNEQAAYSDGYTQGGNIIGNVSLDGVVAFFSTSDDEQLLIVPFVRELPPGGSVEVYMEFVLDAPRKTGRFGHTELGYQLGNCFPVLAVYQDGEWMTDGFTAWGDPYYTETADYTVVLTYPASYGIACTGSIVSEDSANGRTRATIAASRIREFACMLTDGMLSGHSSRDGVRLRAVALSEASMQRALELAEGTLSALLPVLGAYPYETLTIAQAELYEASGMEYPSMIFVHRELFLAGNEHQMAATIAHEIAHQWFYGVVGSDQINAPWLDESLASWFGLYALREISPEAHAALQPYYLTERAALGGRIDAPTMEYGSAYDYADSVYWRGASLYEALLQELGADVFYSGVAVYLTQNAYGVGTKDDVIAAFSSAAGRDLSAWFEAFLQQPVPEMNEELAIAQ